MPRMLASISTMEEDVSSTRDWMVEAPEDTVVPVRVDLVALVENILRLLPETKTIAIIVGSSPMSVFGLSSRNGYWLRC